VRRRYAALKKDLNRWVREFELGEKIEYRDLDEDLFSIFFQKGKGARPEYRRFGFRCIPSLSTDRASSRIKSLKT